MFALQMKDMLSEKMITLCFYRELNMNEIQLIRITKPYGETWGKAMEIYDTSFPPEEKRPHKQHIQLMKKNNLYHFYTAMEEQTVIGIIILWKLQKFIFLDYLATLPNVRNKGYGKRIVEQLKKLVDNTIILEVELPDNDLTKRRIDFYTRLGFNLLDFPYYMPQYNNPKEKFAMLLMSSETIDQSVCKDIMHEIHTNAYNSNF